ncbi:hypothetical protein B4166_1049 [Caldibacillus thermoamylovorans]|uniref:Uncharacterized protein n=1 Tax=Caldibacillus thermoamylovorans TaxID=35841 RepID=A0ABD4A5W6_9BACI|nr:hypothetical protein B4166_1049 [Caldibacillus thermoamylovorans]KIO72461.1 hypothetical protein B4167_1151 [Caldibacillus thermoamylovorans]
MISLLDIGGRLVAGLCGEKGPIMMSFSKKWYAHHHSGL